MIDRWAQLTEILGVTQLPNIDLLNELAQALGETPNIDFTHDRIWFYDFPKSGISFSFDSKLNTFTSLTIFVSFDSEHKAEVGPGVPYSGKLPFGIERSDSAETLEEKLPGGTRAVKDYRFDVDLRPFEVTFHLKKINGTQEKLILISVDYSGGT